MLEWGTIQAYSLGWLNVWNALDTATYLLQARLVTGADGRPGCLLHACRSARPAAPDAAPLRPPPPPHHTHAQISITSLHLTRNVHSGYLSIACAVQCIMLLFRCE